MDAVGMWRVRVHTMGGELLAELFVDPGWTKDEVLSVMPPDEKAATCCRTVLHGEVEIRGSVTLAAAGVEDGSVLTLVYRQRPAPWDVNPSGPEYKLVLVGDAGVGKSSLLQHHVLRDGGTFGRYHVTCSVDMRPISFMTNWGPLKFLVWDTAGQERFSGLRDGYYINSACAIVMFDVSSRMTFRNVPMWYRDLTRVCDEVPSVLVCNKIDVAEVGERTPRARTLRSAEAWAIKKNKPLCQTSVKTGHNLVAPFLWLARSLTGRGDLEFVDFPSATAAIDGAFAARGTATATAAAAAAEAGVPPGGSACAVVRDEQAFRGDEQAWMIPAGRDSDDDL